MAREMPGELKRYEVKETTRSGGGVTTTYKLTEADARARGLIPAAEAEDSGAQSKKREAPTGRARKEAGSKSSSGSSSSSSDDS